MSTSEEAGMTMQELLAEAQKAESIGVPVDWKSMCFKVYNVANNYLSRLEAEHNAEKIAEKNPEVCDERHRED